MMEARLIRKAPEAYEVADTGIRVTKWGGYWHANRVIKAPEDLRSDELDRWLVANREIARAHTLVRLREYLTRYLTDREAGTLGARSRYGWSGDARPVAR